MTTRVIPRRDANAEDEPRRGRTAEPAEESDETKVDR
jgi:hypothetical protein